MRVTLSRAPRAESLSAVFELTQMENFVRKNTGFSILHTTPPISACTGGGRWASSSHQVNDQGKTKLESNYLAGGYDQFRQTVKVAVYTAARPLGLEQNILF